MAVIILVLFMTAFGAVAGQRQLDFPGDDN
jgi:hypothetical protein